MFSLAYNLPTTTSNSSTFCQKSGLFNHQNYVEKSKQKHSGYFDERNYIEKSTWKQGGFFDHRNYIVKVRGNNADFSTIEITSKKVRGNNLDFSTIEITSKKVRGNDVDFSISKITSKKYVEMTWKFVEIWSLTYPRNIHVESTLLFIARVTSYFLHTSHQLLIIE